MKTTQNIEKRIMEYAKTLSKDKSLNGWEAPQEGWVKLNVDATVSENFIALVVVAKNKDGEVLKVSAKVHEWCSPLQAEVAAVLWTIQLALSENQQYIIIEGDAKSCFDFLTISDLQPNWSIATTISNILDLRNSFLNCNFHWVRECYNTAAHEATKYAIRSCRAFFFNKCNLPIVIADTCKANNHLYFQLNDNVVVQQKISKLNSKLSSMRTKLLSKIKCHCVPSS